MLEDGLPSRLAAPLGFLFDRQAPASAQRAAAQIESLRTKIAVGADAYRLKHRESSFGPVRVAEPTLETDGALTSERLATVVSVPKRWGQFLHLCSEVLDANVILEMGACVGISGAYLASTQLRPCLFTLEGSPSLAVVARATLAAVQANAEVIVGTFEEILPLTLERVCVSSRKLDIAFLDGHHDEAATLHYVHAVSPYLSDNGLIILDDIYLYEGMWRAWQALAFWRDLVAVNTGRFGLLVHERGGGARHYNLAPYTGRWRVGAPRVRPIMEAR
jgi:predicted O-methyltransferase YrrM